MNKGFSMLELLLVLGIIAGLIVSAFIIYPKVKNAQYIDIESKHISQIYAAVKSTYSGKSDYAGLSTTVIARPAQFFPDDMLTNKITWGISAWGGYVVVDAVSDSPSKTSNSAFAITYSDVPSDICVRLISAVQNSFYNIYVANKKGISEKNIGTLVKSNGDELDLEATANVCSAEKTNNQISFVSI